MTAFRIAAQTRALAQPFKKALHTVASLGCEGIQIDARQELRADELGQTGLRQLRKILDDLNLRVGSVVFPTRRGFGELADLERRVDGTIAALELASRLQARVVVVHLGDVPTEPTSPTRAILADVLSTLSTRGLHLGVQIAVQANFNSCNEFATYVDSLPEGTLAVDLHPVQLMAAGHAPQEFATLLGKHIAHVHAADAVKDFAAGRSLEVELGRGSVDFPSLLGQLEEHEYRDWITIERTRGNQIQEDIANAVQYLRSV